MASVEKRARGGQTRWYARYRDPAGKQRVKVFGRKVDAERFLTSVEASKLTGDYIAPERARLTVGEWSQRWLDTKGNVKPSTRERYAGILRAHVDPRWGPVKLSDVSHAAVQQWVSQLDLAPATVRKTHRVMSMVLALAVRDGRIARNACAGITLPRTVTTERRYLTHRQVAELAELCGADRLVVQFLAYTGVRFGEMAALRVGRLDLLRRRGVIAESVTEIRGGLVYGTPKGHQRREVPIPRFLADVLAQHVAGKGRDDLVFVAARGGTLRVRNFRRGVFDPAAHALGLDGLHPHELRHTAASLAIAAGANVKVVQTMLGHKSATMTLDLYGHLFPDQLDQVADALDNAVRALADVYPSCTKADIVDLETWRQDPTGQ